MSPLSNADRALVGEIVRETVQTPEMHALFAVAAKTAAEKVVKRHLGTCPTATRVDRVKWLLIGIFFAGAIFGLMGAPWAIRLLMAL